MDFLESLLEIPNMIVDFLMEIFSMLSEVMETLYDFLGLLQEFDTRIVDMTKSCGSSEFTGMSIVDAIGTSRYLVGDVAFMMIYFSVLVGCLLTIYKLVVLLLEAVERLKEQSTGGVSTGKLGTSLRNIFK